MRLLDLSLENIGPFDHAKLTFLDAPDEQPAVAVITGQNGTGKTIVLDAIRMLLHSYGQPARKILRDSSNSMIEGKFSFRRRFEGEAQFCSTRYHSRIKNQLSDIATLGDHIRGGERVPLILDYWQPALGQGTFEISQISRLRNHSEYLSQALSGAYKNTDITDILCHFDYLRGSEDPSERNSGEILFKAVKRIVQASLLDGEFLYIKRSTLTPMIRQGGQEVPLSALNTGGLYLISRLLRLLERCYSLHVHCQTPPEMLLEPPGLLLIDEAETHLHPLWQKRLFKTILELFPNLQIIATTHSPFIVSSLPGARVFVCRYEARDRTCVIDDVTASYANLPVDEVLMSEAFDHTRPFNQELSKLVEEYEQAAERQDEVTRSQLEKELMARNPNYFGFLDLEAKLERLHAGEP